MGLREQSIVGCFPEFVFLFSVVQVLVGLRKQFINNFVFPTRACAAGFNNNNIFLNTLRKMYSRVKFGFYNCGKTVFIITEVVKLFLLLLKW